MLGTVGGIIAIIGVIVLPVTSGDTAFRSLRLILGDALHLDQSKKKNALTLALSLFAVAAVLLFWAKGNPTGFNIIWRYFSWANETTVVFVLAMIAVYMQRHKMPYLMAVVPGTFYMYVVSAYILNAKIGLNIPWTISYIVAAIFSFAYAFAVIRAGKNES